jgi:hypothetical protein
MRLGAAASEVISLIQEATGIPVEVTEDASLPNLAVVTASRPGIPFHLIRVNPNHGEIDYLVVFQSGFLLRQASIAEALRWQFALSKVAIDAVSKMLAGPGGIASRFGIPSNSIRALASQMTSGLLVQLRSVPVGLRIDKWIYKDYPSLRELQKSSIISQCQTNLQALAPQIREMTPATIWKANCSMNATYAMYAAQILGDQSLVLPYRSTGIESEGQILFDLLESIPDSPEHDQALIDAFGQQLGVSDWYQFIPNETP